MPARSSQPDTPELGIAMVGYAFMGAAHSRAWATVGQAFDVPLRPRMTVLAGRDGAATRRAARRYGWRHAETDWHALIERDDVQLVDICTPGDTHAEIAIAALDAGKHVLCEKPLANSLAEAEAMADAAVPLTWRLQQDRAGSGALGDIGAHAVDLAQHLSGEHLAGVSGLTTT